MKRDWLALAAALLMGCSQAFAQAELSSAQSENWPRVVASGAQRLTGTVTINAGDATGLSGAIDLAGATLFALVMPADWTMASLSFQASVDCVTFGELYNDSGTEVTVTTPAASEFIVFASSPAQWLGIRCVKIRSGTAGAAVTQAVAAPITVVAVP